MIYRTFDGYLKNLFGCKVYKLALRGGETCPNRDGTKGVNGCAFCAGGSGDFAEREGSVSEQIERAKKRIETKIKNGKYIAYFQSYTATYGNVNVLREKFGEALKADGIVALSVATRPDCLGNEVLSMLKEFTSKVPVFVELGLQTTNDAIAKEFNRCYPTEEYFKAVENLHKIGATVVTHLIIGLPNETRDSIINSVIEVGRITDGIKLQLLHVLKDTRCERDFRDGKFRVLELDEYAELIADCLSVLPENVVVHRLTGDAPKRLLVAPMWSADKKRVLNTLTAKLKSRGIFPDND